jgi:uncharacterized membrane protein
MSDQLVAIVRGLLVLGILIGLLLVIAALVDSYLRKKSPGLRKTKKLTSRDIYWAVIIVLILFLLGLLPGGNINAPGIR